MKIFVRAFVGFLVLVGAAPVAAQDASGRIKIEAEGIAADWSIVSSPPRGTFDTDGTPRQSVFAPQSGDFAGVDMLVMWAMPQAGATAPLMLAAYQRVSGEPSFVDQYFKGLLYHHPEGMDGGWVADFGAPGSEMVVDSYSVSEDIATASGHSTTTAYFEAKDADEPDPSRALPISGTFEVQLPRLVNR